MSDRVLWEETPEKRVWFVRDGENMIIETEWNVDAVVEANKAAQADFSKTSSHGDLIRAASIPTGLYWDWQRAGIVDDATAFARKLNDSEYQHLRVNTLRV